MKNNLLYSELRSTLPTLLKAFWHPNHFPMAIAICLLAISLNSCQSGANATSFEDPRDGRVYPIVKIGDQVWMAENMQFKTDTAWCYEDQQQRCDEYGYLYHWNAAQKACPKGWHLPTDQEWLQVSSHFKDQSYQGLIGELKLKMSGFRYADGFFVHVGQQGHYWTQSSYDARRAWYYGVSAKKRKVSRDYTPYGDALSCRCVQDAK